VSQLFESLKRLFQPRPRPSSESVDQPSADRPPPRAEPAPSLPPAAPVVSAADQDVTEIRALLEAVAEAPSAIADAPLPIAEPEVEDPPPAPPPAAVLPEPSTDVVVDVPTPAAQRVDALVLMLATPAATFTVAKAAATIGRGQENTIRLDDLSVSRRHARIAYKQGGYWLSDLGSMGGTWVDGTRLNAPHLIATGQIIDIGLCRLTVSSAGAGASVEAKTANKPRSAAAGQARRAR